MRSGIQGRAAHDHSVPAVAIDISHGQAGTAAVEPDGQQPLQGGLVDRFLARTQRQAGCPAHLGELPGGGGGFAAIGSAGAGPAGSVMVKRRSTREVGEGLHAARWATSPSGA